MFYLFQLPYPFFSSKTDLFQGNVQRKGTFCNITLAMEVQNIGHKAAKSLFLPVNC